MNKYRVLLPRAIRRGKMTDVEANTSYEAAKEVARIFNLRSTAGLDVYLIAVDDTPVAIDTTTLGA
jgi:Ribonuclease G/E